MMRKTMVLGLAVVQAVLGVQAVWAAEDSNLDTYTLDTVVVTANRYEKPDVATAASTEIVTEKKIKDSGATNAQEALSKVSGMISDSSRAGGGSSLAGSAFWAGDSPFMGAAYCVSSARSSNGLSRNICSSSCSSSSVDNCRSRIDCCSCGVNARCWVSLSWSVGFMRKRVGRLWGRKNARIFARCELGRSRQRRKFSPR